MTSISDRYVFAGIMFFDVQGYSKLDEIELCAFHDDVVPTLYNFLHESNSGDDFLYTNTWGDGIVLLHKDYERLARLALSFRDYFNHRTYTEFAVLKNKDLSARISLHHGEFLCAEDRFQGRSGYFGLEIVKSARIEPVTPPGRVWATSEFQKKVTERFERQKRKSTFSFLDRGEHDLAKAFGTQKVWELTHYT